ncbi:MAG: glycogen debranching enzyme, partial [Lachnospiraceae bacterium]|nr:glycogen debranching enzyme [Lachnospiraceae bacterium]
MQGAVLSPLDEVNGYSIRPGFYRMNGAFQTANGVSFTINSHNATKCILLLFKPQAAEPFVEIPIPEEYKMGDTYSVLVFGLKIQDFEYAYRFEGPNQPEKGLIFNPDNIILDPYARAVTGQFKWGEKNPGEKPFQYKARVVKNEFDWGAIP